MATKNVQEKWEHAEEEEDIEEEALSLSDLPVTLINQEDQSIKQEEPQEEFNFNFSKEPEMCVADEVFFQGKILPLRLSFSSEASYGKKINLSKSRSQSLSEFRSNNSSRSSSIGSQNSSSSTSTSTTTTTTTNSTTTFTTTTPKIRNQFHTHPSPKPQLKLSSPTQASFRKSSVWEIFRLGVVPAPEIGLQDLKVRSVNKNCDVTRNSSSSEKNESFRHHNGKHNDVLKYLFGKGGGLLSGCDCSVETVQSGCVVMSKGGAKSNKKAESSTTHAMKEKVGELKKQKQRKKQGKKVMSRRRTFEWLKELHASHPDEEALLSNPS